MIRRIDIETKRGYFAFVDESGKLYFLLKKYVIKTIGIKTTEIEESLFFEIYQDGRYKEALEKTVKAISLKPRTSVEINDFLDKNKYNDVKDKVVAFLKDKKFMDDDSYCELFITYHKETKLESRFYVMMKLMRKFNKMFKHYVNNQIDLFYPKEDEKKIADELIKKMKYKNIDRESILRKLSQRGFQYSNIKRMTYDFFDEEI